MQLKEYQDFVKTIAKKFDNKNEEIMTWGLGVAGEAGDIAGCIKKTFAHDDDQRSGIRENVGDTLWYLAAIANYFDWDLEEIFQENVDKLKKRFPNGFNAKDAARDGNRIDWNE